MSFLSSISNHRSKNRFKRVEQQNGKNTPVKTEYLLNEKTPFNVTEAFRNLKAAISVSVPKKSEGVVIMATSAYPEEGKTTVTANLALMFAVSDAKVVLVDADIRKGRIARYFKRKNVPGLSDYLSGQASLSDVVHRTRTNENLSYITCGTRSPRPYELLESEEMKNLIAELKKYYDYVIIDTPPILMISDALALTPIVDGTVLVCRHQMSYVNDISQAINALRFSKANILGVIVNDYKETKTGKYGVYGNKYSYYSSHDDYGYASSEATEEKKD